MPDEASMSRAERLRVQEALRQLGYYKEGIDGVFGPGTRAAIRRFQGEIGAETTGRLTAEEASRLVSTH
jgi:peptidoglycan hydrolase-like protein with peptidoglycan-binding domain